MWKRLWWVVEGNFVTDRRNRRTSRLGNFSRAHAGAMIAAVVWAACICVPCVNVAGGFPPVRFENAAERVTGPIGRIGAVGSDEDPVGRIIMEAGRMRLFGIPEFGEDGIRVSIIRRRFAFSLSGAACTSPVGSEHAGGISLRIRTSSRVTMGIGLHGALTNLDACERSSALATSTLVVTRISQRVSVAWLADDVPIYGETPGGADMSLCAAGRFEPLVTAFASIRIDRWGKASIGYAASMRMGNLLGGYLGYEGASEQIKTAVELSHNSWTCEICAFFHPVLGLSNGIFLQWRR